MSHKIIYTNISWDIDYDDIPENELVIAPPEYVYNLDDNAYENYSKMSDLDQGDAFGDILSNTFGWAVNTFQYELT